MAKNVVLTAITIEARCPHCGAAQPGPDGTEAVDVPTAKDMCDGKRHLCTACDEPIQMIWHDKVHAS